MIIYKYLTSLGSYIILMGRTFSKPERFRMFWKQYVKEMAQLGVDSIGIVLLISFFIGAVIYYVVYQTVVFLGFDTDLLKILAAVVVILFLGIPYIYKNASAYFNRIRRNKKLLAGGNNND